MANKYSKDRYQHDQSQYERPANGFKCGRADLWGKPCQFGPSVDGQCQGVSECRPYLKGDRWECRRAPSAGGRCESGPNPDGSCCNTRPPCSPVATIRRTRGHWNISLGLLALASIALSVLFVQQGEPGSAISSTSLISPGELKAVHHAFSVKDGCETCHLSATDSTEGIATSPLAIRQPVEQGCNTCHTFAGATNLAHNSDEFTQTTQCTACHSEHKGQHADITQVDNQQCASCHSDSFSNFTDHAEFGSRFPHRQAGAIIFDHAKHLNFHFDDKKYRDTAPTSCSSCHTETGTANRVGVASFDTVCAACHLDSIVDSSKSELALMSLPKLKLKSEDEVEAFAACLDTSASGAFKSAGSGRSNPFMNWLLDADFKETEKFATQYCGLISDIKDQGINAILTRMETLGSAGTPEMFTGLNSELLLQASLSWLANDRYRPPGFTTPEEFKQNGWIADKKGELRYKPVAHADPVVSAWLEFSHGLAHDKKNKLAKKLSEAILSEEKGAGACNKCHNLSSAGTQSLSWATTTTQADNRLYFNHQDHLGVVGSDNALLGEQSTGCLTCHKLAPDSDYADTVRSLNPETYQSNFASQTKATCAQCHKEGDIRNDCRTCHQYHSSPALTNKTKDFRGEAQ